LSNPKRKSNNKKVKIMLFDVILTDWNLYHFFIMWFSQYDIILIFLFSLETNEAILKSAYDCRWNWHRNDSRFFGPYKPLKGHRSQFAIRRKRRAGEKVAQIRVTSRSELTETDSLGTSIHRAPIFSGPFIDFFSLLPLNAVLLLPNERSGVERSKNDHDRDAERDDFACLPRHHPRSNFDEMNKHRVQTPRVFREWRTRGSWTSCGRNRLRN